MSRPLALFLTLILLLLCAGGAGVWWLGADLVRLAFVDPRRDEPYALLDFHNPSDPQTYTELVLAGEAEHGARAGARYDLAYMQLGRQQDERDHLHISHFNAGRAAARLLTDPGYREVRDQALSGQTLIGAYDVWQDWPPALLVVLAVPREAGEGNDGGEGYNEVDAMTWLREQTQAVSVKSLRTSAQQLSATQSAGDQQWREMLLIGFADEASATTWLRSDDGRVALQVAKARAVSLHISLYVAPSEVPPEATASS